MKKIIAALTLLSLILAGCADGDRLAREQSGITDGQKIKVAASFYPLAEFARQAGGSGVEVFTVTPPGAEPHEYEPTPKDITEISRSKLLLMNGGGQDEWAERIKSDLTLQGIRVMDMSEKIEFMNAEEDDHADGEEHDLDPHIWLDPVLAKEEVLEIRDALIQISPADADAFTASSQKYAEQLASLDEQYRDGLKTCKRRDFVTSHRAFGYLAKRYNLTQVAIAGLSTEEEPSAKRIAEIADMAQEKGIRYIFFETLASPRLSETIATEIGAQTLILNPIEGLTEEEMAAGKNYVTLMQENLNNLRTALECE